MLPFIFGEETVGLLSPLHVRQAVKHQAINYHGPERRSHKRYRADVRVREMVPGKQELSPLTFGYGGISCVVDKVILSCFRDVTSLQVFYCFIRLVNYLR